MHRYLLFLSSFVVYFLYLDDLVCLWINRVYVLLEVGRALAGGLW